MNLFDEIVYFIDHHFVESILIISLFFLILFAVIYEPTESEDKSSNVKTKVEKSHRPFTDADKEYWKNFYATKKKKLEKSKEVKKKVIKKVIKKKKENNLSEPDWLNLKFKAN